MDKGLASARPGQVVKYAAVAPELALERLVSDHREKVAELERETAALIDELRSAFHAGKEQANPLEVVGLEVTKSHEARSVYESTSSTIPTSPTARVGSSRQARRRAS